MKKPDKQTGAAVKIAKAVKRQGQGTTIVKPGATQRAGADGTAPAKSAAKGRPVPVMPDAKKAFYGALTKKNGFSIKAAEDLFLKKKTVAAR